MSGYLPPGCTQRECDEAQPGYWDDAEPSEQWFTCSTCEGSGVEVFRITVYEHGCGFPHDDGEERPCRECGGEGGYVGDAESEVVS